MYWEENLSIEGTVIIVEDDPTLRYLMTDILSEISVLALAFETADDALTYLLENCGQCSLVIVDQALPGRVQGDEFIKMLQNRWPKICSILTSGYLIDPIELPAFTIFLHKPWLLDDLMKSVVTALKKSPYF